MSKDKRWYNKNEVDLCTSVVAFFMGVSFFFQKEWMLGMSTIAFSAAAAEIYFLKCEIDAKD